MTDPRPERDQPPDERPPRYGDRPIMGDHVDLETEDQVQAEPAESGGSMTRVLVPALIVVVIVLLVIGYFVFID